MEDHEGIGVGAVGEGGTEDGRLFVEGGLYERRTDAFAWARVVRDRYPSSRVLAGPALIGDQAARDARAKPAHNTVIRVGLALLRDLLATDRLAHFDSPELTAQVAAARVTTSVAGLKLVAGPRCDLLRAALWALVEMEHNRPLRPAIYGPCRPSRNSRGGATPVAEGCHPSGGSPTAETSGAASSPARYAPTAR